VIERRITDAINYARLRSPPAQGFRTNRIANSSARNAVSFSSARYYEMLSVVAMRSRNSDRSPLRING
jgi:hypothetical protein